MRLNFNRVRWIKMVLIRSRNHSCGITWRYFPYSWLKIESPSLILENCKRIIWSIDKCNWPMGSYFKDSAANQFTAFIWFEVYWACYGNVTREQLFQVGLSNWTNGRKSYGSYHIIWTIWYGPYDMVGCFLIHFNLCFRLIHSIWQFYQVIFNSTLRNQFRIVFIRVLNWYFIGIDQSSLLIDCVFFWKRLEENINTPWSCDFIIWFPEWKVNGNFNNEWEA